MKYICNARCWVAGLKKAMFEPGEIVDFSENEEVPSHFTCIEEQPSPVVEEKPLIIEHVKMVEEIKEEVKEEVKSEEADKVEVIVSEEPKKDELKVRTRRLHPKE